MDQKAETESKMVAQSSSIAGSSHKSATGDGKAADLEQYDEFVSGPQRNSASSTTPRDSLVTPRHTRSAILREGALTKRPSRRDQGMNRSSRSEAAPKRFVDKVRDKFDRREKKGTETRNTKEIRSTTSSVSDVDSVRKQRAERRAASRGTNIIFKRGASAGSSEVKREVPTASSRNLTRPTVPSPKSPTRTLTIAESTESTVIPKSTTELSEDEPDFQRLWSFSGDDDKPLVIDPTFTTKLSADEQDLTKRPIRRNMDTMAFMEGDDDSIANRDLETKPSEISIVKSFSTRDSSDMSMLFSGPQTQKFPNLHLDLAACAWEKLHQQLEFLTHNPKLAIPTIALTYPKDGATPLHTASWKAPSALALMVIRLLPSTEIGNQGFLQVDMDGNTPLHLCCANLSPFYDSSAAKNSKPILDLSVLEQLLQRAPEALAIKNGEGDTPLHLFVGSPAACYSDDLSEESSLKALSMILDHFSSPSIAILQDYTGATPLHVAVANEANKLIVAKLLDAVPEACMVEDEHGMVPLHYVAAFLNVPVTIVEKILEVYPLAVCHKTENGDTPLHLVVRNTADAQSKNRGEMESNMYHMYESMTELNENTRDVVNLLICCNGIQSHSNEDERENNKGMGHKNCALLIANEEKVFKSLFCIVSGLKYCLSLRFVNAFFTLRRCFIPISVNATTLLRVI